MSGKVRMPGEVVEEGLAGHVVHMAAQAQHVIGGQGQGQFRTAAVEAGNFGMAGKAEGLARFQLGQVFHEFAAGVFFHDAFSCWKVVGAGQCLGKISLTHAVLLACILFRGLLQTFSFRKTGCGAGGRVAASWQACPLRCRHRVRFCVAERELPPLAGSAGGPCRPFYAEGAAMQRVPGPLLGRTGVPTWCSAGTAETCAGAAGRGPQSRRPGRQEPSRWMRGRGRRCWPSGRRWCLLRKSS